jgi:hypothetical protein
VVAVVVAVALAAAPAVAAVVAGVVPVVEAGAGLEAAALSDRAGESAAGVERRRPADQ